MFAQQDRHEMHKTSEDGHHEIWECPICHRVVMIQWIPLRRIVIESGDEDAEHFGLRGMGIHVDMNMNERIRDEDQIVSDELASMLDELDFLEF